MSRFFSLTDMLANTDTANTDNTEVVIPIPIPNFFSVFDNPDREIVDGDKIKVESVEYICIILMALCCSFSSVAGRFRG